MRSEKRPVRSRRTAKCANCPNCWRPPGTPTSGRTRPDGVHLAPDQRHVDPRRGRRVHRGTPGSPAAPIARSKRTGTTAVNESPAAKRRDQPGSSDRHALQHGIDLMKAAGRSRGSDLRRLRQHSLGETLEMSARRCSHAIDQTISCSCRPAGSCVVGCGVCLRSGLLRRRRDPRRPTRHCRPPRRPSPLPPPRPRNRHRSPDARE